MIVNPGGAQKAPEITVDENGLVTATAGSKVSRRQAVVMEAGIKASSTGPWKIKTEHEIQRLLCLTGSYLYPFNDGDSLREYVRFHANTEYAEDGKFYDVLVTMALINFTQSEWLSGGADTVTATVSGNTVTIDFEDFFETHCNNGEGALTAQIIYIPAE